MSLHVLSTVFNNSKKKKKMSREKTSKEEKNADVSNLDIVLFNSNSIPVLMPRDLQKEKEHTFLNKVKVGR